MRFTNAFLPQSNIVSPEQHCFPRATLFPQHCFPRATLFPQSKIASPEHIPSPDKFFFPREIFSPE